MQHPVGIIGGGPVGLSAAISLARQGISSVLIEKHPGTTNHPKARGINGRTMELFRQWGVSESMKQYQMPPESRRFTWIEDFQGKEITRVESAIDYSLFSPSERAVIAQDCVEKELFAEASGMPLIDLRFNTEMMSAVQDANQVTVEIVHRDTQQKETLHFQFLIAADGAYSPLRKQLNVEMEGEDNLGEFCNIYCEMDLDKYVKDRPSVGFMLVRPDLRGTFILAKDGLKKWLIGVRIGNNTPFKKEMFSDEFCVEYVKRIINDPQVDVRLINKGFWTMAALIAKQYRVGRVFFAGDSAHRLPPTGGFGMNTGIQDAHNLAWKLAMVIKKQAHESLLDTYFPERHQVAEVNTNWSMSNAIRFRSIYEALEKNDLTAFEKNLKDQVRHIDNILLDLGFVYGSEYQTQETYKPSTAVGARAPHCWLSKDSKQISTLDLFEDQMILVCSSEAKTWQERYSQFPCKIVTIGNQGDYVDVQGDFLEKYAITSQGAVLVRPDGHVAWHATDESGAIADLPWLINVAE